MWDLSSKEKPLIRRLKNCSVFFFYLESELQRRKIVSILICISEISDLFICTLAIGISFMSIYILYIFFIIKKTLFLQYLHVNNFVKTSFLFTSLFFFSSHVERFYSFGSRFVYLFLWHLIFLTFSERLSSPQSFLHNRHTHMDKN